jgi:hypothetical protein
MRTRSECCKWFHRQVKISAGIYVLATVLGRKRICLIVEASPVSGRNNELSPSSALVQFVIIQSFVSQQNNVR